MYLSHISQHLEKSGYVGTPSNIIEVTPFERGPYKIYECPVIHPTSAVHQYMSVSFVPKRYLKLTCAPSKYPAVVCNTPFGFPVEPEV